jgi:enamine deaminase RidA (YjgF/YER057c/UK114 family)
MIERIGMRERWSDAVIVGDLIFLAGHVAEQTRGQSVKV